ncbi:hypothetical protein MBLNU230_g5079t1 [Neophaeotheca triangularis]
MSSFERDPLEDEAYQLFGDLEWCNRSFDVVDATIPGETKDLETEAFLSAAKYTGGKQTLPFGSAATQSNTTPDTLHVRPQETMPPSYLLLGANGLIDEELWDNLRNLDDEEPGVQGTSSQGLKRKRKDDEFLDARHLKGAVQDYVEGDAGAQYTLIDTSQSSNNNYFPSTLSSSNTSNIRCPDLRLATTTSSATSTSAMSHNAPHHASTTATNRDSHSTALAAPTSTTNQSAHHPAVPTPVYTAGHQAAFAQMTTGLWVLVPPSAPRRALGQGGWFTARVNNSASATSANQTGRGALYGQSIRGQVPGEVFIPPTWTISMMELCRFLKHKLLCPEASERAARNGWKTMDIAMAQELGFGNYTKANAANLLGRITAGSAFNLKALTTLGPQNDLTSSSWRHRKNVLLPRGTPQIPLQHMKLSDIYASVPPAAWPTGTDRLLLTHTSTPKASHI